MTKLSIDLLKYRLNLHLVKRRKDAFEEPLLPSFEEIKNTRSGNKFSRFFRHIFEHKNIKKILGTNLALMVLASSFVPTYASYSGDEADYAVVEQKVELNTEHGIQYPVEKVKITQGYRFFHPGIDFDGLTGDPIKPIKGGIVEALQFSKYAYGNAVLIDHGNKVESLYAHLAEIYVKEGQEVTKDTIIGTMGATGRASGDHLHLEVHDHGIP
ncbi:MAG: Peptidase M23, partial [Candidatus Woesebacteria bacterium GW2011_GWB1_40_101]